MENNKMTYTDLIHWAYEPKSTLLVSDLYDVFDGDQKRHEEFLRTLWERENKNGND